MPTSEIQPLLSSAEGKLFDSLPPSSSTDTIDSAELHTSSHQISLAPKRDSIRNTSNSSSDTAVSESHPQHDDFSFVPTPLTSATSLDKFGKMSRHEKLDIITGSDGSGVESNYEIINHEINSDDQDNHEQIHDHNNHEEVNKLIMHDDSHDHENNSTGNNPSEIEPLSEYNTPASTPAINAYEHQPVTITSVRPLSPSKSILKRQSTWSPKKVVFNNSSPQVFHYDEPDSSMVSEDYSVTSPQQNNDSTDEGIPPSPPLHSSNSYRTHLTGADIYIPSSESLTRLEQSQRFGSHSSLSINEKWDVTLGSKHTSKESLTSRLDELPLVNRAATERSIHRLSSSIQTPNPNDNLFTLHLGHDSSFGSSQSSLQSLKDTNRQLQSVDVGNATGGITFNDGIKGIPDQMAESMIREQGGVKRRVTQFNELSEDRRNSFENSYNSTEQSIMNLLNASTKSLTVKDEQDDDLLRTPTFAVKQEQFEDFVSPVLDVIEPVVKPEPEPEPQMVKKEVYPVMTGSPTEMKILPPVSDDSQTSIRFNVDSDWKLEDSNDGDREDNDETNNDVTVASATSARQIDFEQLKLENQYFLDDSFDRESLTFQLPFKKESEENTSIETANNEVDRVIKTETHPGIVPSNGAENVSTEHQKDSTLAPAPINNASDLVLSASDPVTNVSDKLDTSGGKFTTKEISIEKAPTEEISGKSSDKLLTEEISSNTLSSDENSSEKIPTEGKSSSDISSSNVPDKASSVPNNDMASLQETSSYSDDSLTQESPKDMVATKDDTLVAESSIEPSSGSSMQFTSLAPPKAEVKEAEAKNAAPTPNSVTDELHETAEDSNVLANSSNIAPPEEITLPVIETHENSSFEEFARSVTNLNSFEESLSAEHDNDNKSVDFISIWHSQSKKRRASRGFFSDEDAKSVESKKTLDAPKTLDDAAKTGNVPGTKVKAVEFTVESPVPPAPEKFLQTKKFKDVQVKSRRIVSPEFEDLQVSGFLPELSEDSGFENHFKFLKQGNSTINYSNVSGNRNSMTPLSTRNMLSNIDSDPRILEPPQPSRAYGSRELKPATRTYSQGYKPPHLVTQAPPRSRFRVPTFEIKRSTLILSPHYDLYNDIFEDVLKKGVTTIKSNGMKTLPSMDRDDVKRILNTKRKITQEEYTHMKHMNQESRILSELPDHLASVEKPSTSHIDDHYARLAEKGPEQTQWKALGSVTRPLQIFDEELQHGSICNLDEDTHHESFELMPHLAEELAKQPTALMSREQLFNDLDIFNNDGGSRIGLGSLVVQHPRTLTKDEPNTNGTSAANGTNVANNNALASTGFPEPDMDLVYSPEQENNIFKTPPQPLSYDTGDCDIDEETRMKYQYLSNNPVSPSKEDASSVRQPVSPSKTIKIGAPLVFVKNGDNITPMRAKSSPESPSRPLNHKLRSPVELVFDTPDEPVLVEGGTITNGVVSDVHPKADNTDIVYDDDNALGVSFRERGCLFLRVVGFKNIMLPDLGTRTGEFLITLDNGVHCIKTPNYKMAGRNVAIGKEFELTVGESLEFILTMKASYEKPKGGYRELTEKKVVKPKSKLGRLFGSTEVITTTKVVPVDAQDSWDHKLAKDGSFARCYVDLDQFEDGITGEARNFNLTCYNEWETVVTEKGQEIGRRDPYKIGELEVKMLFVPRVEADEILPTSIKSAYESIDSLEEELNFEYEGYLHQEGGDCDTWKRRFFKLKGLSLIAHSEYSHKTRAKINLSKVVDVSYVDKENMNKKLYRNFSGVLLLDHAFKIQFANGETIDFGAPNQTEKSEWIRIIERIIKRNRFRRQPWVKLMLQKAGEARGEDK